MSAVFHPLSWLVPGSTIPQLTWLVAGKFIPEVWNQRDVCSQSWLTKSLWQCCNRNWHRIGCTLKDSNWWGHSYPTDSWGLFPLALASGALQQRQLIVELVEMIQGPAIASLEYNTWWCSEPVWRNPLWILGIGWSHSLSFEEWAGIGVPRLVEANSQAIDLLSLRWLRTASKFPSPWHLDPTVQSPQPWLARSARNFDWTL